LDEKRKYEEESEFGIGYKEIEFKTLYHIWLKQFR